MKKLLFQFDTDTHPSVFDTIVGYDGGADHVIGHGRLIPENVSGLVEGAIFTRAPKDKKNTAIFVGGSDMVAGADAAGAQSDEPERRGLGRNELDRAAAGIERLFPDEDPRRSLWAGETGIRLVLQRLAPSPANLERLVEMYSFVAIVYFLICFFGSLLVKRLQMRVAVIR